MHVLSGWENFYVIVGSSAGALIGLQFVVMTLIAEMPAVRDIERAGSAFSTPTIVHLGAVLLLSAVINAPWRDAESAALAWGVVGIAGTVYTVIVTRRMRQQRAYQPVFEDWFFHSLLPLAAYVALAATAYVTPAHSQGALFGVGGAALALLFTSIHNAWDAVVYHVTKKNQEGR